MKKFTIIFIFLFVVSSFAFSGVDLNLSLDVGGENFIKLSAAALSIGSEWNFADEDLDLDFGENVQTKSAYLNLRTNKNTTYYANVSGAPMTTTGVNSPEIGYIITPVAGTGYSVNSNSLEVVESGGTASLNHLFTYPAKHGMRVVAAEFTVTINDTDRQAATEGDYEATVTFSIDTN